MNTYKTDDELIDAVDEEYTGELARELKASAGMSDADYPYDGGEDYNMYEDEQNVHEVERFYPVTPEDAEIERKIMSSLVTGYKIEELTVRPSDWLESADYFIPANRLRIRLKSGEKYAIDDIDDGTASSVAKGFISFEELKAEYEVEKY